MWKGMLIGSGTEGSGASLALIDVALGDEASPVAAAWASAFASTSPSMAPFLVHAEPGLPVKPFTLFVPKVASVGYEHDRITRGAAQAGVAAGVVDALRSGVIPLDVAERALLICTVWVDASASEAHTDLIFTNNRRATLEALDAAGHEWPTADHFIEGVGEIRNPNAVI